MSLFGSSSPPETFPEVRATTLDGEEQTLPADLPAPLALIVVLFQDDLDPLADQWARLGHQIEERHPGLFAVIETPVVGRGMKLFGSLATLGIRGQVEGDQERARTLPIYVDKKPFRKALKLSGESEVSAFLVTRDDGKILWTGEGSVDLGTVRRLESAVEDAIRTLPAQASPAEEPTPSAPPLAMSSRNTPGGIAGQDRADRDSADRNSADHDEADPSGPEHPETDEGDARG